MKEIGGYFGFEEFASKEYYQDLIAVNNARNALAYVLKAKKIKKLYIPYFLCDSVEELCKREGYKYEFYKISPEFTPIFDKKLENGEYLYIVNYYGQIDNNVVAKFKKQYCNIILDNVQAFFQTPVDGVDTLYSCRKFFGVPDGGYLSTDVCLNEEIPQDISMGRMKHVLGRFEGDSASDYYADFKENDSSFKNIELRLMSRLTHNILGAIDYKKVRKIRESNFKYLEKTFKKINKLEIKMPIGPYVYPLYLPNGMEIKKKLAQKKIFVATLWPNVLNMEGTLEKDYAENIIPLPIDQRYNQQDMKHIVEEVLKCID